MRDARITRFILDVAHAGNQCNRRRGARLREPIHRKGMIKSVRSRIGLVERRKRDAWNKDNANCQVESTQTSIICNP